jgi:predicted DNA-binding protein (MmcQ/YjbR family)
MNKGTMPNPRAVRRRILAFALTLPGAYEDHPWGETVVKVNKKIFVFLGLDIEPPSLAMTVKLDQLEEQALMVPSAAPAGYGLGRAGWVTVPFAETTPPLPALKDWVEESYRLVAPKRLVAELDSRRSRR